MTRLGSIIFTVIGVLFVGFVALMIRLALRGGGNARKALEDGGWTLADGQRPVRWSATRTRDGVTTTLEVKQSGVKQQSVWTELSVPVVGSGEVLVTRRAPAMLSADGVVASVFGAKSPPRWGGGTPAFRDALDAWATDDATGARLLTDAKQGALVAASARLTPLLGVHFANGRVMARLSGEVEDAALVEGVVTLLEALAR
jgi:hypothetical protein